MEGGHVTMYSTSCNTTPFPVSKQIQSIDPMIVSVHNVFENSPPSFGHCWNVRMVCIQSETDHSTAFQKECDASLEIMQDFAHGYLDTIIHCVILQHCYEIWDDGKEVVMPEGFLACCWAFLNVLDVCLISSLCFSFACCSIRNYPMVLFKKYTGNVIMIWQWQLTCWGL